MTHFVFGGNFELSPPPPLPSAMLNADENVIDEFLFSSARQLIKSMKLKLN